MKTATKRDANIELLRILSVFFVVLLHKGGLLPGSDALSLNYTAVWRSCAPLQMISVAAACAVDLLRTWLFRAVRKTHKNDISSKLTNKVDALYENITSSK